MFQYLFTKVSTLQKHLFSGTLTRNLEPQGVAGQDELPVPEDGNVTITPVLEGDIAEVAAITTSVAVKVAIIWSQNLFLSMVDASRDAF